MAFTRLSLVLALSCGIASTLENPEPKNFQSVGLNTTSIFATWDLSAEDPAAPVSFNLTYIDPKTNATKSLTVAGQSTLVAGLAPNTLYDVEISVLPKVENATVLGGNFTTLAEDYASPVNVTEQLLSGDSSVASFNVSWSSDAQPAKAASFEIKSCNRATNVCSRNETEVPQIVLPFDYFANYDLTVTAVYKLALNQVQERSGQVSGLQTPGTAPSIVSNITLKSVTTTDAILTWDAPENIPSTIAKIYKVFDAANNVIVQSETEQVQISNLSAYSLYDINIEASVLYNKQEYSGNQTSFQFYTDSAAPGAPATVKVTQNVRSNIIQVFWEAPTVQNGPLDYYEVLTEDQKGNVISNLTNLVSTKSVTVQLPAAHGDAKYTVSVRAVNVNVKNEHLPGNATEYELLFKGIGVPTAEVVHRTNSSLTFKVTPASGGDLTGLFYVLKHDGGSLPSSSDHIELPNLPAYSNETVEVYACYRPTFCSEAFTISEFTNVGAPAEVTDLKGETTNVTVPVISWSPPETPNGPIDGYELYLDDLTNSSLHHFQLLPANQTSYTYDTTLEFELFNITVAAYNLDLDDKATYLWGAKSITLVKTSGTHPPKPDDVREVNKTSTSASFVWQWPNYPGFNVTHFRIAVPSLDYELVTNETQVTLDNLKPWTRNTILTSGCLSDNVTTCGQPGSYFVITEVDKPTEPLSVSLGDITKTEASVSWKAPATPNGPINGYRVAVSTSDKQNLTWIDVESGATSYKLSDLSPKTKYTAHVVAYNINDDKEELLSPISTSNFTTAGPAGFAWWIVVVALVVVAAGAAAGVVLYRRKQSQQDRDRLIRAELNS